MKTRRLESLEAIYAAERLIRAALEPRTVRCQVRRAAIVIELDAATLQRLAPELRDALALDVGELFQRAAMDHPVQFSPYRRGSAVLHAPFAVHTTHG